MPRVTLDLATPRFRFDGEPRFLLADTLWSAFTGPTWEEWRSYLRLRRRQGFNAVNVNILSFARSRSHAGRVPFRPGPGGEWDLDRPDPDFFAHARAMARLAVEHGIVPVLVVLWNNYVPGTWGAESSPELVLTGTQTDRYLDLVVESFGDLGVLFAASGDDNFTDDRSTQRYRQVLHRLRRDVPDALLTLHPGVYVTQPPELTGGDLMDFYCYQAGHDEGWETQPYEQATALRAMPVRRPIVSIEPCYEGHWYGGGAGRHTAVDVRRAAWCSLLAGSGAGLGYGAHGVWSWHREGEPFGGEAFSGTPFPADVALRFSGAWDVGLLRQLAERYQLYDLADRPDLLPEERSGARIGVQRDPDRVVVYLPHPLPVTLALDLSGYAVECWNLGSRHPDNPGVTHLAGGTRIEQPEFLSDAVYIFTPR
jgi:hypothetical protein